MLEFVFIDKQVVETYREIGGLKLLCMGSDQTEMSQHRVKEIIKDEMLNFKGWFWVEVSDAIEYFFKKTNGLPIPNVYATEILSQEVEILNNTTVETEASALENEDIRSLFNLSKYAIQEMCTNYVPMVARVAVETKEKRFLHFLTLYLFL